MGRHLTGKQVVLFARWGTSAICDSEHELRAEKCCFEVIICACITMAIN